VARGAAGVFTTARAASRAREASVVIAAAAPHRADAFAACRYAIERIKQIAPIWKHEHFAGGDVWIEGATADAADQMARAAALERACV
jgi:molybdopterin synthase catalytic subunit